MEKHGILDGVFEPEQTEGVEWLKPTNTFENMIQDLWANHMDRRKTSKRPGRGTKTDEAAHIGKMENTGQAGGSQRSAMPVNGKKSMRKSTQPECTSEVKRD